MILKKFDKYREYEPSKEDLEHLREWLKKMPHIVQDYGKIFKKISLKQAKPFNSLKM